MRISLVLFLLCITATHAVEDADWSRYLPAISSLGRPLRIATPCAGIDGCGHALSHMGPAVTTETVLCYDIEPRYTTYLEDHLMNMGMSSEAVGRALHVGKVAGDLLRVPLEHIASIPVDILCSGPPCPPWATQGKRGSLRDPRARVFVRLLEWAIVMIKCCGLLICVLENVIGITQWQGNDPPVIGAFLEALEQACPEFHWGYEVLHARLYKLPQRRTRVFIKGVRRCLMNCVPKALPAFGSGCLADILGDFPNMERSSLCTNQQVNLEAFENKIRKMYEERHVGLDDIAVVSLDRAANKTYAQRVIANVLPTLTTNSTALTFLSVKDVVEQTPDTQRVLFRKVHAEEKLQAQGFPKEAAHKLSHAACTKAAGNAYPVPLIAAVLHPMIAELAAFSLREWPTAADKQDFARVLPNVRQHTRNVTLLTQGSATRAKAKAKAGSAKRKAGSAKAGSAKRKLVFADSDSDACGDAFN